MTQKSLVTMETKKMEKGTLNLAAVTVPPTNRLNLTFSQSTLINLRKPTSKAL